MQRTVELSGKHRPPSADPAALSLPPRRRTSTPPPGPRTVPPERGPDASPIITIALTGHGTSRDITELADKKIRREIESILDACAHDGYRVRNLLVALVQSRIFLGQ